jgi:hypothetical protein
MKYRVRGACIALLGVTSIFSFACSSASNSTKGSDDGGAIEASDASTTEATSAGTTFADVYPIIASSCTTAVCHYKGVTTLESDLDMSSQATAYAQLVGVPAAGESCAGMGLIRVIPGNVSMSLLYEKVSTAASSPCGSHMPLTGSSLSLQDQTLIQTWIMEGANP